MDNTKSKLQKANEHFNAGDFETSLKISKDLIRLKPGDPIPYIIAGKSLYAKDNPQQAVNYFNEAYLLDSTNTETLFYSGLCLTDLEKFKDAITYYNKAIKTKGNDSIYLEMTDNFSDLTYQENITMAEIRFNRGLTFFYNSKDSSALNDFFWVSKENYNQDLCYYYIGLIAYAHGKNDLGCKYLTMASNLGVQKAKEYMQKACK